VPLRPAEVNRILGKVDELAESEEEMNIPYVIGETVKVIDGPFNSFSGIIEEIDDVKKKLKLMVKIFGRKTPLELNFMQVEKE
jgi:transcriptional antiterminator NusG